MGSYAFSNVPSGELYLWNPSIGKMIVLPPARVTIGSHGAFMHNIGFGFDPLTHDYKVVRIRIVYHRPHGYTVVKTPREVDIFTLSTGTWRNISHLDLLPYVMEELAPLVYLKGAAHWIANDMRGQSLILSFHMGDEVFHELMLPASIGGTEQMLGVCVTKFQESISLIANRSPEDNCCIWVMKEYGAAESWSKQFNIDMDGGYFRCLHRDPSFAWIKIL